MEYARLYYACDASFADFFGASGLAAIDQAFAVYNNLTNLSTYSTNLAEWPLTTTRMNYTAESLGLLDVKSVMMSRIIEILGLTQPDRYVWTLHDRFIPTPVPCPIGEYYVTVQRNFDPVTYQYSSFVNGTLYDYFIAETCTGSPIVAIASPSRWIQPSPGKQRWLPVWIPYRMAPLVRAGFITA